MLDKTNRKDGLEFNNAPLPGANCNHGIKPSCRKGSFARSCAFPHESASVPSPIQHSVSSAAAAAPCPSSLSCSAPRPCRPPVPPCQSHPTGSQRIQHRFNEASMKHPRRPAAKAWQGAQGPQLLRPPAAQGFKPTCTSCAPNALSPSPLADMARSLAASMRLRRRRCPACAHRNGRLKLHTQSSAACHAQLCSNLPAGLTQSIKQPAKQSAAHLSSAAGGDERGAERGRQLALQRRSRPAAGSTITPCSQVGPRHAKRSATTTDRSAREAIHPQKATLLAQMAGQAHKAQLPGRYPRHRRPPS